MRKGLTVIAALTACAGCAPAEPGPPPRETPSPAAAEAGSPLILYDAPVGRAYPQALGGGVLRRDGQCVYLVNGAERRLLILPSPTARWDAARGTIRFGGKELRFGDRVPFGGGASDTGMAASPQAEAARRAGCDTRKVWWASPEMVRPPG